MHNANIRILSDQGVQVSAEVMYGQQYQRLSSDQETPQWHSCVCQETFSSHQPTYSGIIKFLSIRKYQFFLIKFTEKDKKMKIIYSKNEPRDVAKMLHLKKQLNFFN